MKIKEDRGIRAASNIILALFSLACLLPFILLIISSFTDEAIVALKGYSFFPEKLSIYAYAYLSSKSVEIGRSYLISIVLTILGTSSSLAITSLLAYPLSKPQLPFRNVFNFFVVFTMLFSGGLVPSYLIYTQIFHIKNTFFALWIPGLLMNGFNVMLMRAYFSTSIPPSLIDAAKVDGAGEMRTFRKIVLPMSLPMLATIGLFTGLMYWNDWNNGLIYLTKPSMYSLQNLLNRVLSDIQYLKSSTFNNNQFDTSRLPTETARMAIATISVLPILMAYPFFQKYFVKGIALGAVKE